MKLADFKLLPTETPKGVQAMLNFGDYKLSIIQNEMSYGNAAGLFEIAVFKNDNMVELPGITSSGDTVAGHLTEDDVDIIIKKMYLIAKQEPKQI